MNTIAGSDSAASAERQQVSLSARLLAGFLAVAAIALVIGVAGFLSLRTTDRNLAEVSDVKLIGLNALQVINEAQTAIDGGENALLGINQPPADAAAIIAEFDAVQKRFSDAWKVYEPLPQTPEEATNWKDFVPAWNAWWKDHQTVVALAKTYWDLRASGKSAEEASVEYDKFSAYCLNAIAATYVPAETLLKKLVQINYDSAMELRDSSTRTASLVQTIMIVAVAAGVLVALLLGILISRGVLRQLGADPTVIEKVADRVADGDLGIELADIGKQEGVYRSVAKMVQTLREKGALLDAMAKGDLSGDVRKASEVDGLGQSLKLMSDSLNQLLGQVSGAVEQVNAGAGQVAAAGQSLSQGATEQASSLEEISASVTQISSQTRQNADNATQANALSKQAMESATKGNEQMQELVAAMEKIAASSNQIKKVVKVIDDIAFQTNLLALNANVEAARAGKYGKGFAVVADEVRNLAVRSAQSVKETTEMVEGSVQQVADGNRLVTATAAQLSEIVQNAGKAADLVEEITTASKEQANALDQITAGLSQIDQVTQANTASAEESAAAGEELSSQAGELRSLVARFRLKDGGAAALSARGDTRVADAKAPALVTLASRPTGENGNGSGKHWVAAVMAPNPKAVIKLDDGDYGKF